LHQSILLVLPGPAVQLRLLVQWLPLVLLGQSLRLPQSVRRPQWVLPVRSPLLVLEAPRALQALADPWGLEALVSQFRRR